jgi:hypothetical protein
MYYAYDRYLEGVVTKLLLDFFLEKLLLDWTRLEALQ